ncbi:MAG: SsrA-binding protein [Candidatus Yanofskybacteria bacterium RIFCSPHIGHO2_01_FULL_44_17]|uniref:SsrA-binding protein n=1 Tax=Candidatus Yanofskybacteria bacterium RIFCSPHIGHO2_01_FULL_44_17 TaxID=1802668 RepID=A0A1F8EYE0_9BACT|nr:MAG: SsrA-binding protein [Candidatus Yanofskybacteria bacterium RIFCSPHIGHO2_01_FULL_44_17]
MVYSTNEKARFDYEILETLEAGVVLSGQEVKSVKRGSASIKGAYVKILNNEAWLLGATIPPYQAGNAPADYDSQQNHKLLLKRRELKYLTGKSQERGLTLVPIKLYNKNGLVKLEIGIGRGKKKSDKREKIVKRETARNIERALKQRE